MRVAMGLSGFLSSQSLSLVPHLQLRREPQYSSPELTWISGFLWSFNRGVRPHFVFRHGSHLSSRAVKVVSGFLLSWHRDLRLSLKVLQGCHTFHHLFELISRWQLSQCRGTTYIWSGLGHRCLLEFWHDPWSSSRVSSWDHLLLRYDRNAGIPSPTKQGNGHSSRDEEGKTGLFLSCGGTLGVPLEWRRVC